MFRQRLKGGHRVQLQATAKSDPVVQNDYNSQGSTSFDDRSWNWEGQNTVHTDPSTQKIQNTVNPVASSDLVHHNQQNVYNSAQYLPSETYNPVSNSEYKGSYEQGLSSRGPSQTKEDWNWETNNWGEWDSGSSNRTNQQNVINSQTIQEPVPLPTTTQQSKPISDYEFDKVDYFSYMEKSESGGDSIENRKNFSNFPNDNNCIPGYDLDFNNFDTKLSYDNSQHDNTLHSNQQHIADHNVNHSNSEKFQNLIPDFSSTSGNIDHTHLTQPNINCDQNNVQSDLNWENDNWNLDQSEQVIDQNLHHQNPTQIYQPSTVIVSEPSETVSVQQTNSITDKSAFDDIPNYSYDKEPSSSSEVPQNTVESAILWQNANWSNSELRSDTRMDSIKLEKYQYSENNGKNENNYDITNVESSLKSLSIAEVLHEPTSITSELAINGNIEQNFQPACDEILTEPKTETVPFTECRSEEPAFHQLSEQHYDQEQFHASVEENSFPFNAANINAQYDSPSNSDIHNPDEFDCLVINNQLISERHENTEVSNIENELNHNDNLDSRQTPTETIHIALQDNNILIPNENSPINGVGQSAQEQKFPAHMLVSTHSRTTSLTDSNIASLNEELHGIFSSPTDLVDYPSPEEYRNRSDSFTHVAQPITETAVEPERDKHSPDPLQFSDNEIVGEMFEAQNQPPITQIQKFSLDYNYPVSTSPSVAIKHENTISIESTTVKETATFTPSPAEAHFPSPVVSAIPNIRPHKNSPFQPPEPRRSPARQKPLNDVFDYDTVNQFSHEHSIEPILPKNDTKAKRDNNSSLEVMTDYMQNREATQPRPLIVSQANRDQIQQRNDVAIAKAPSITLGLPIPEAIKMERSSPVEEQFTRMIPGESTKGKRGPITHPAPPAMPTGRVVTGNDDPQPLTMRIKQEQNEIRSPPDGPDTISPINHDGSVIPPIRSETIGSEEPSGISKSRKEMKSETTRERGINYDSSSGEYYADRYPDTKRQNRFYYKDESPHNRHSYEREQESLRRRQRCESDEDEDDRVRYGELRNRRHRSYRDDTHRYGSNMKEEASYHRKRDRRQHDQDRRYRLSTTDDEPFYPKSDRSRPSSRSSSPNNLEGLPSQQNQRYPDKRYERQHRLPSNRDYHYDRSDDKIAARDPYFREYGANYPEQYGSRAMYDQQSYYYYYQKYMEQHPYYRDYYRQYYGRNYGYPNASESYPDDKGSIRSGRSSVNDEVKKTMSSLTPHDPYGFMYGHPPQSPYHYSGDVSGIASVANDISHEKPHRLTPHQFGAPHFIAKFTPVGKLLVVLPRDPKDGEKAIVQVKDVRQILGADKHYSRRIQQMKNYAGPIAYNDTHKDVVIRFCAYKISEASANNELEDKQSVVLLWEYLSLLVKQNGKVCGADLASLLIEQKNKTSSPVPLVSENSSDSNPEAGDDNDDRDDSPGEGNVRPFTEYLCLGRRKEAVEYAIQRGLWGHAMILASKMDSVIHTRVMTAFLNSIPTSDVLQTAVQHMSGKRPDVTKNFNPDRWGDWREHLAVLVSNFSGNMQRDMNYIIGLGDTLASRGQLHAAHICYLAGEAEFGTFADKSSKIVLIGSSHNKSFQTFVSEEAFQCTEVYEYAKSLDGSNEVFHSFQSYKFIYALRLAECGFAADALRYCEVVSALVCQSPQYYQTEFVAQILELASRLKFNDPHYQLEGDAAEMQDPEWLQSLSNIFYMMQMQNTETKTSPVVETIPTEGDVCVTDSKEVISTDKTKKENNDITLPSAQIETQMSQNVGYSQPILYENNYAQSNIGNFLPSNSYADVNMPPVVYDKSPEVVTPFQQQPSIQPNEAPVSWQPTSQQESPVVDPLQRRSSEEEEYWTLMGSKPANNQTKEVEKTEKKSEAKEDIGSKDGDDKKPGFFGSLFGWKKSNQAKLPDDSNPSIVWDEVKKKWVNKDGEEETDSPLLAPPTSMTAPPPMVGSFRGGARISRYVDPVGDQRKPPGTPAMPANGMPPNIAPAMSPNLAPFVALNGAVPTMQNITPTSVTQGANGKVASANPVLELDHQTPRIAPVSNRQVAGGDSGINEVPMMGAPPMFNPNQFSGNSVPSTGSLPRKSGPARRAFGQR